MPPLKNIDRGIDGDLLKALEESGHEQRIAIVDPSYSIPEDTRVLTYHGVSSSSALRGILELVDAESLRIEAMIPDDRRSGDSYTDAYTEFQEAVELYNKRATTLGRNRASFMLTANDPEEDTLFIRTRDEKAYACAMFTVAAAQK